MPKLLRTYQPDDSFPRKRHPRTEVGSKDDRKRIENVIALTAAIGDTATYMTRGINGHYCHVTQALESDANSIEPSTDSPLPHMNTPDQDLQATVLQKLRDGIPAVQIMMQVKGFNAMKLAAWRKNDSFIDRWDEAKEAGKSKKTGKVPTPVKREREVAHIEPLVFVAPPTPPEVEVEPTQVFETATEQGAFFMVAHDGEIMNETHQRFRNIEKAQEVAEARAKMLGKPTYVLRAVMEVLPEVVVVSTKARVL